MAEYTGWSNYETWCANLWITNEQSSQEYWEERATEAFESTDPDDDDRNSEAASTLEDELKEFWEDHLPEETEVRGLYRDLLTHALGQVDWREIAKHFIDGAREQAAE